MKPYGEYCALAKALEIVGERWTLLIVRELMARRTARYTDLRNGLPGIASNLLADRLRELEGAGIVVREDPPPPVATAVYRLTARGEALRGVIRELGLWGAPLLADASRTDEIRGYWITLPAALYLEDARPDDDPVTLELRAGDEPVTLRIGNGSVTSSIGPADKPDAILTGPARSVARVLLGGLPVRDAGKTTRYEGAPAVLSRLRRSTQ
ncbi:MAG: winged helix-turn-helix transcriptional regulator [Candidatus Tyrphobacter sp.]